MLRLLSMNLYDMEGNSRLENLTEFKLAYAGSLRAVSRCLEKFFPSMTREDIQSFIYAFSAVHIRNLSLHFCDLKAESRHGGGSH